MIRRTLVALAAVLTLAVGVDVVFHPSDPVHPWWHRTPGFFALFGLVGCVALVKAAKLLGRLGLQRPEGPEDEEEETS